MHSDSEICFASVRWISSGKPDPEPDVKECSRYSWKQIKEVSHYCVHVKLVYIMREI
jgi:hypothetical protein